METMVALKSILETSWLEPQDRKDLSTRLPLPGNTVTSSSKGFRKGDHRNLTLLQNKTILKVKGAHSVEVQASQGHTVSLVLGPQVTLVEVPSLPGTCTWTARACQ